MSIKLGSKTERSTKNIKGKAMSKALEILKDIRETKWCGIKPTCEHYLISDFDEAIEELYDMEAQLKSKDDEIETLKKEHGYEKCKKCTHYSCGTQPDSFGWEKCGWDWECKSFFEDHFEPKGDA